MFKRIINKLLYFLLTSLYYPVKNLYFEYVYPDYILLTASVSPLSSNWGDDVSVRLVEFVNPCRKVLIKRYTWNIRRKYNLLCIGSIISWMTTSKSVIWGSGVVYPNQRISAKPLKVCAVRGPLTREYLINNGVECPEIYGDPALLFPRYYQPRKTSMRYELGLIPHFRDKNNPLVNRWRQRKDVLIIDVQDVKDWRTFIDQINMCKCICSSSLHGIIVSDAYGVPNAWGEFVGGEKKRFAFYDYLASVHREDKEPLLLNDETTLQQMMNKAMEWKGISIDLDRLLSVCPFK